jgi:hypothetical protein
VSSPALNPILRFTMAFLSLSLALWVCAGPPPAPPLDANAAFERLKKLEGAWKSDGKDSPAQYVVLRVVAGGSALLETVTGADRLTVTTVTVYGFEGSELWATHVSAAGTQRLRLKEASPRGIRFDAPPKEVRLAALVLTPLEASFKQEVVSKKAGREVRTSVEFFREYVDALK